MRRRPQVALTLALLLAALPAPAVEQPVPPAEPLGVFTWRMDDPLFGGMSAIDVGEDGLGFIALSDRGSIVSGRFRRDAAGLIEGIEAGPMIRLRGRGEEPLPNGRNDSEGLAVARDGTIYISFEIAPRVLSYDRLEGSATYLKIPRDFNRMAPNGALEALAVDDSGTLYTLPEVSFLNTGARPVYRWRDGVWDQPFTLPPAGDFLPAGADFGPDGRLYLLERDFGMRGFATRVRRFTVTETELGEPETVIETEPGTYANLEGLSVWRDGQGRLRLTMIADNNFHSFLRTQIVEYAVRD